MPVNAKLIFPAAVIERPTFPIEGISRYGIDYNFDSTVSCSDGVWETGKHFSGDANQAWERLKKRHQAQFAQILDQYGNPIAERADG